MILYRQPGTTEFREHKPSRHTLPSFYVGTLGEPQGKRDKFRVDLSVDTWRDWGCPDTLELSVPSTVPEQVEPFETPGGLRYLDPR